MFSVNTLNMATMIPGHTSLISIVSSKATDPNLFSSCELSEHSYMIDLWQELQSKGIVIVYRMGRLSVRGH